MAPSTSRLFTPVQLGGRPVHRVALAPLTRLRNSEGTQIPQADLAPEYYAQRASSIEGNPGLLITEATFIAREAGGYPRAPGIYSKEQIAAWKLVTDAVHAKGGLIALQAWALGRANVDPPLHGHMPDIKTVSASPIPIKGAEKYTVHEMTQDDIDRYVNHYRQAAANAIEAGFDFVEIHGANGYLIDQFTQSVSNKRTDKYGGSIENRTRFALEVVDAVCNEVGAERVGIRFSPWSTFQDMQESDPVPTFSHLLAEALRRHSKLAYVHYVEPREWHVGAYSSTGLAEGVVASNDVFRAITRGISPSTLTNDGTDAFPDPDAAHPTVFLSAGAFDGESAGPHVERTGDCVAFGRHFIANPDLPRRLHEKLPFNKYDRDTFYTHDAQGYTKGYPLVDEAQA